MIDTIKEVDQCVCDKFYIFKISMFFKYCDLFNINTSLLKGSCFCCTNIGKELGSEYRTCKCLLKFSGTSTGRISNCLNGLYSKLIHSQSEKEFIEYATEIKNLPMNDDSYFVQEIPTAKLDYETGIRTTNDQ
jgi:hypothetical protein